MNDGYTRCPNDLLRDPRITPVEKVVWLFISSNLPGFAYSAKEACATLGIARSTWFKTIESLLKKGMIKVLKPNGQTGKNTYSAVMSVSRWEIEKTTPKKVVRNSVQLDRKTDLLVQKSVQSSPKFELPPPYNRKDQDNTHFVSDAHTREGLLDNSLWAQTAMKNLNVPREVLEAALEDATLYCLSNDITPSETNLKHYAVTAIKRDRQRFVTAALAKRPEEERRQTLLDSIAPLVDTYGKDLCNQFYSYWAEMDSDGVMRYEREQTWDTAARLSRFGK